MRDHVRNEKRLRPIKEDLLRLGSSSSETRKGFLQLYSHPVIQLKRATATQRVKDRRPHSGGKNRHNAISNQKIGRSHDTNNNVKNAASPDFNRGKPSSMGPSDSRVESRLGCINQKSDCTAGPSTKVEEKNDRKKDTGRDDRDRSKHKGHGHRDPRKTSRDRDRRSRSRSPPRNASATRKLILGENPNGISWVLPAIDPEAFPEPHSPSAKLRWIKAERKRKMDQLSAKIIEIFGEDSDEDETYLRLSSPAKIPQHERRTTSKSLAGYSTERSTLTTDVECNALDQTPEQRSPILSWSKMRKRRKRTTESSDETIVYRRKRSKNSRSGPSHVPNAAAASKTGNDDAEDTAFTSSDVPTDPDDRNYRPRNCTRDAHATTIRDRSTRKASQLSLNECPTTITIVSPNPDNRKKVVSADEDSLDSASTTKLFRENKVDDNERDSRLISDLSSATANVFESAVTLPQTCVTRDEPHVISEASSCANGVHTDMGNQDSAITGNQNSENPTRTTTPTVTAASSISDTKPVSTDSQLNSNDAESESTPAALFKTLSSRPTLISDANPIPSSTTTEETDSSDRLMGALDNIFLSLLSRRRINESQQSASKLAIKQKQEEEVRKAQREFQSRLAVFRDEFLYLLEKLGTWDQVLCFIAKGLDHRTPASVEQFTEAEVYLAMVEAKLKVEFEGVKEEPSTDEREEDECLIEKVIFSIDLTEDDNREKSIERNICDSSTDPVQRNNDEVRVVVKSELADDCSTCKESAEPRHDLNANEIPLTVPSIAEVKTISHQQFETIGEKPSSQTQEEDPCLMCSRTSHVACGRCLKASYCTKKCQEMHWKHSHHMTCVPRLIPITDL